MDTQEPYAAVLSNPSPESLLAVTKAVSTAIDGQSVKLASDSLTTTNILTVMTNTQSTMEQNPINGRIMQRPQHFQLMLRGTECFLVHDETAKEYILENIKCEKFAAIN